MSDEITKEFERLLLGILLDFSKFMNLFPNTTVANARQWMKEHPYYLKIKEKIVSSGVLEDV